MDKTLERPTTASLLDAAQQTSRGMRAIAEGKPADFATHSDAKSFVGIARLIDLLAGEVERQRTLAARRGEALARIAELKVRGGGQLIEAGNWQKLASELREIAGETLAAETTTGAAR